MRLARHKDVLPNPQHAADLTVRAAINELTEPKWPEKPSELVAAIRCLPIAGHVRIGLRRYAAGWDEVWIAPSYEHPGYFYVTHVWTPLNGLGSANGSRRPMRAEIVAHVVAAHLSLNLAGLKWSDKPSAPWNHNIILFTSGARYVNGLDAEEQEDLQELADIAAQRPPSDDVAPHVKAQVSHGKHEPRPLAEIVFGEGGAA